MDKSSRVIDITEDSSDYDQPPQYVNRKVTLYNSNDADEEPELSITASSSGSRKTSAGTIVKRKYEDIIIADSEEEDTNNRQQHTISPSPVRPVINYSHERELLLKNLPERLISIFLALSSTEPQIRLSAFTKMKELVFPKPQVNLKRHVLAAIEGELGKTSAGSEPCQLAALDVLKGLSWVRCEVGPACLLLLKLISGGAGHVIRCEALITLEAIMNKTGLYGIWRSKLIHHDPPTQCDNFDILSKLLQLDLSLCELIFSVLSYLGANDIYKQIRCLAMEIIGKIPGQIRKVILVQSLRKDQIRPKELEKFGNDTGSGDEAEEGEIEESHSAPKPPPSHNDPKTRTRRKKASKHTSLPLLCCGVFAHGIEDQFVQIRFKALASLFALATVFKLDKFILNVFLDSLLDECDLIRLAALKYMRSFPGGLQLTVEAGGVVDPADSADPAVGGLESLLAVLDDQNRDIRREALIIIGDNLILSTFKEMAVLNETLLRTQKCLEAALLKYPEMEFQVIRAAYKLVHRHSEIIRKTDFWSHLMQCPIPKFMTPTSLLPYSNNNNNNLSPVQAVMQIPLLPEAGMRQSRLTRILSRIQDCEVEERLSLLGIENAKIRVIPNSSQAARLFNLRVPLDHLNNLQCLYEAAPSDTFFFFENKAPRAYFKLKKLKIVGKGSCDEVHIEEFKMIGSMDHVQLDLIFDETPGLNAAVYRFKPKYDGALFVAKCPKGSTTAAAGFKIYNCNTRAVVHYHAINKV